MAQRGQLLGIANPTSTAETLLKHKDVVTKGSAISKPRSFQPGGRTGPKAGQGPRYPRSPLPVQGTYGATTLKEELEAENEGIRIPSTVRWLCRSADVKACYNEGTIRPPSVVFAVLGEAGRYDIEVYEETRLDAF